MKKVLGALGCFGIGTLAVVIAAVIAVALAIGGDNTTGGLENAGFGGGIAEGAPVPADIKAIIVNSVPTYGCAQTTPSLIAAQLYTESGFNPDAQSKDAAGNPISQGIAQFTPATWAARGVDGNGDGVKDVWNPQDAIPAQIAYDCYLANIVRGVPGDSTDTMLAAYNAGPDAVQRAGGIPPITETRTYVSRIRSLAQQWAATVGGSIPLPAGSGGARQAIAAAEQALGKMYQFGGNCRPPFDAGRNNACDCSSLVQYAWSVAGVNLPRTSEAQVNYGTPVQNVSQLQPGDLLFTLGSEPGAAPSSPGHVGMYAGNNQVIEAPHTGAAVRLTPLDWWTGSAGPTNTIVAMRHIG
ncbi:MAG: C40 family peptidase [Streptomycetaceae bacterium]|nr:C40 family peptidase [Streptomycetaceae bacterium]